MTLERQALDAGRAVGTLRSSEAGRDSRQPSRRPDSVERCAAGDREKAAAYLDLVHWRKCLQLLLLQGLTG